MQQNTVKHGETLSEQIEKKQQLCVAEISLYYGYKQDNLLMGDFPEHMFYSNIQENALDGAGSGEHLCKMNCRKSP